MSQHDIFVSVEEARARLETLRARLEADSAAEASRDVVTALHDVRELLETLSTRYGLLRDILDRTSDVAFAKDVQGRYTMINPEGARLLGKSVDDVLGQDDHALFGPADAQRIASLDREVMRTGVARRSESTYDLLGLPTTLLTTTTTWRDREERLLGVIGISQDVTERRRREREAAPRDERMRSLAAQLVIGEERLRFSLAAELQSGLGQDIALVKLKLATLRGSARAELHDPLVGIEELVERADRALRSITFDR